MDRDREKMIAAQAAVELVEDGMTIGLGTGSTAKYAVESLADRVKAGLKVRGVPTSNATAELATKLGIPLVSLDDVDILDLDIDGADEATRSFQLTKGGGGALLREKIVACSSKKMLVICDSSKLVDTLGAFPLPVEIVPFAKPFVERTVKGLGGQPKLRIAKDQSTFVTDQGNWILDCNFGAIENPAALADQLARVPGIVEHGLFVDIASEIFLGCRDGVERIIK